MKNRMFLLWMALLVYTGSYAQPFSKLYIQGRPSMLFSSVQAINNKFYVTGVTTTVRAPNYEKALLGKIDSNGDVIFINAIADSAVYDFDIFTNALKKCSDGNIIAIGQKRDSMQKAFLMKADTNGNILFWHEYTATGNLVFQGMDVVEIPDSGYLLAVNIATSDLVSHVIIIRTDTVGNEILRKDYYNGVRALPWIIKPMNNGHYMVGAFTGENSNNTPYWAKTWLIEVDGMANRVRDWVDTSRKNLWPNGMEQTADSGWIIVRQHLAYDLSNNQAYNGSILKLDKNFNRQWELDTGGIDFSTGMFDVKILSDGGYICVGSNTLNLVVQGSVHDFGWLMKISETGEILWQRNYLADSTFGANNYLNSIEIMPDGGFVACGSIESSANGQQGWIIRTDSNGCLLDNCGRLGTEISELNKPQAEIKAYPNPARNYVQFEASTTDAGTVLFIYDMYGRTIIQKPLNGQLQINVNTETWPSGIFLWMVRENEYPAAQGKLEIMK